MLTRLRTASIGLHSDGQLVGRVLPRRAVPLPGVARFLVQTRQAHVALRRFPVATRTDFADVLDNDLAALSTLVAVPAARPTAYSEYLDGLDVARLGCHWYNLVFAHICGGGRAIYDAIAPSLPEECALGYYECIPGEDAGRLREELERQTAVWSAEAQEACVRETAVAFGHGLRMLAALSDDDEQRPDM